MIGIYGGTFDPPHSGHLHVATTLQKLLQLREVWWVVTKRNTLKQECSEGLCKRKAQVSALIAKQLGMRLIGLESSRSMDVVQKLFQRYPTEKFVFLAGTDVIGNLHKWFRAREFGAALPIIFLERPGYVYNIMQSPFAVATPRIYHLDSVSVRSVSSGWGIVRSQRNYTSSTKLRQLHKRTLESDT